MMQLMMTVTDGCTTALTRLHLASMKRDEATQHITQVMSKKLQQTILNFIVIKYLVFLILTLNSL